jgi:hypothetical protein
LLFHKRNQLATFQHVIAQRYPPAFMCCCFGSAGSFIRSSFFFVLTCFSVRVRLVAVVCAENTIHHRSHLMDGFVFALFWWISLNFSFLIRTFCSCSLSLCPPCLEPSCYGCWW